MERAQNAPPRGGLTQTEAEPGQHSAGAAGSQDADTAPKKPVKAMLAEFRVD
jgi:hypothetical protein